MTNNRPDLQQYFADIFQQFTSMNESINNDQPPNNFEHDYSGNWTLYFSLFGIRYLQVIIGSIGNGLTLHIIRKRRVLTNGHILMVYLAISDLLTSCMVPLVTFVYESKVLENSWIYWKTLCMIQEYVFKFAAAFSILCYCTVSVDR